MIVCDDCGKLVASLHNRTNLTRNWKTVTDLMESYMSCQLCNFIVSAKGMYHDNYDPENPLRPLKEYEQLFREFPDLATETLTDSKPIKASGRVSVNYKICAVTLVFDFNRRNASINLAVWLDGFCWSDVPLDPRRCGSDVTIEEPLKVDDSPETFRLLRSWFAECAMDHQNCSRTIDGEFVDNLYDLHTRSDLPSRILDIGRCDGDSIRLVETHGEQGPYIALSYCWGPESKHPIRTTHATLKDHLSGIPFTRLPKTFQDAVKISRELHVRYLWIDSLCIVQDDEEDWLRESARMGAIYENARLVVAASSAQDPTEGCFVSARSALIPLRIVCEFENGTRVKVWFYALPAAIHDPRNSPLGHRAWACQEWYLARRMIFCTEGGFSWKCKTAQFNERRIYYDMHENHKWESLLQRYSECHLTYEKDRLIALQGIANELGKTKTGEYHFGLWTDDLPKSLFWMMREFLPNCESLKHVPSWSWASRSGCKLFWKTEFQFFRHEVSVVEGGIHIDKDGRLNTCAPVQKVRVSLFPLGSTNVQECFRYRSTFSPESALLLIRDFFQEGMPTHYIQDSNSMSEVAFGLAAFDKDFEELPENIYAVALLTTARNEFDPLYIKDAAGRFDTSMDILIAVPDHKPEGTDESNYQQHGDSQEEQSQMSPEMPQLSAGPRLKCDAGLEDDSEPGGSGSTVMQLPPLQKPTLDSKGDQGPSKSDTNDGVHKHSDAEIVLKEQGKDREEGSGDDQDKNLNEEAIPYDGHGSVVHWVLLLEPVEGIPRHFRRIGMGLFGCPTWLEDVQTQELFIV